MDDHTAGAIARLRLRRHRPLLICDVDEVVVRFVDTLRAWLRERQLTLHPDSWCLEGNIRRATDGIALPGARVRALLEEFFRECAATMPLMPGAASSLRALAENGAQIVMLTNIPHAHARARCCNLRAHGLDFPLITNQGPKGPAVRALRRKVAEEVVFMDDHPDFLDSAHAHSASGRARVHLVHYIPDSPFVAHLPCLRAPHVQVRNWREASTVLPRLLGADTITREHGRGKQEGGRA